MNYSLLRESRVVVLYEGRTYEFDAHANVSAGIEYQEYKVNRKTLHKRRNYPYSKVTAKNPASISLALNLTDNRLETKFFEWLGMGKLSEIFYLPEVSPLEPIFFEVYIITPGSILFTTSCFVSAIDFTLEKDVPLLNIAIEGANCQEVYNYPEPGSISQGNIVTFSPLRVNINNNEMPAVNGAGLSFQQQCEWREQRTIHDIGKIYTHKRAYVSEMNASATVNFNLVKHFSNAYVLNSEPEYDVPVTIFNKHICITFPNARITKRLSVADIYQISYDIIPMESSVDPVAIQFYGENKK